MGVKEKAGFKATNKLGGGAPTPAAAAAAAAGITGPKPPSMPPLAAAAAAAQRPGGRGSGRGRGRGRGGAAQHPHLPVRAGAPKPPRRGCWLWINAKTLEGALDPLALAISLAISLAAVGAGIYSIVKSCVFCNIQVCAARRGVHTFPLGAGCTCWELLGVRWLGVLAPGTKYPALVPGVLTVLAVVSRACSRIAPCKPGQARARMPLAQAGA
jgi:hypothetical protein